MPDTHITGSRQFELFAFWRTSATYRVRVAMNLKGLAAHERIIDLDAGEQRSAEFLRINPIGAIPALVEHGHPPLTQSTAIMEFLDETAPGAALLPSDPYARARVRSIAAMLAADTHPLVTPRVKKYLTTTGGFDNAAWRAWQVQWFTTGLRAVEQRLASEAGTGAYCHGDAVSIADICLMSIMVVLPLFKLSVTEIPTIDRIAAYCGKHEAFARAHPLAQAGAPQS